jgi:Ca-activated chloride channel family protein
VGVTDKDFIAAKADDEEGEAIYLVGVGVGNGYNDTLMDAVTDAGKGAYVFVDTEAEAMKIFGDRFQSTMEIAVMDVQVELTLPPWLRVDEYHGEEISTDPKEVEPQHLAPNDAMVFHQLLKSCEEPVMDQEIRAVARYTDPATRERMSDEIMVTIGWMLEESEAPQLVKGTAIVEYAEGLKDIADLLEEHKDSEARELCNTIRDSLSEAADLTGDEELQDVSILMGQYCGTMPSRTWPSWY